MSSNCRCVSGEVSSYESSECSVVTDNTVVSSIVGFLDNASALAFFFPDRCLIVRFISCIVSAHLTSLVDGLRELRRDRQAAWSVYTVQGQPSMYRRKCLTAHTSPKVSNSDIPWFRSAAAPAHAADFDSGGLQLFLKHGDLWKNSQWLSGALLRVRPELCACRVQPPAQRF